jgi:heat shock protein HslJ
MKRVFVLLLFGLAGCIGPQAQRADVATLAGNWRVVTLGGTALPETASVTIDFAAPSVSGNSGCNRYTGSFSQTNNDLAFGPTAMTRKACPPARMDVETAFTRALAAITRYEMAENTLRFFVGDTLILQARPR